MLTVVGSYNQDLFFAPDTFPQAGETVLGSLRLAPGGKGFNQAIAAARMGAEVSFIGALGNDTFARGAQELAAKESIQTFWQVCDETPTGSACILLEQDGSNRIVVAPGANAELSESHIRRCTDVLSQTRLLLVQGEVSAAAVALAIRSSPQALHILNPAPVGDWMYSLLDSIDLLTPNETELATLARARGTNVDADAVSHMDADQLRSVCAELGPERVIVTLGSAGCFVHDAAGNDAFFVRPQLASGAVVDTTGAGDCLSGTLAAGLVAQLPLRDAVTQAVNAASLSVTRHGAAPAMPSASELSEIS